MAAKKYLLRQGFLFFNAFLLAFEPTAWAVSKPAQEQTKEFLEKTEISKAEVRFSEFFKKIEGDLPESVRAPLEQAVKLYPNAVLPKFSVTKIKGDNGEEDIQLQFVKDKKSAVITLIGRGNVFAKVGSAVITNEDMKNPSSLFAKLNKEFPDPNPTKPTGLKFKVLSSADFAVLSAKEQKDYIKKLRKVLETAEHLQNSRFKTVNGKQHAGVFDLFISEAFAGSDEESVFNNDAVKSLHVGDTCIYAGHVADYGCKNGPPKNRQCSAGNGYKCGGEGSDFSTRLSDTSEKGLGCTVGVAPGIRCNSAVYGDGPGTCVKRSNDATKDCNDNSSKFDYFEAKKYENSNEWDDQKTKLEGLISKQKEFCEGIIASPKKALYDQKATCDQLTARIKEIQDSVCPFGPKDKDPTDQSLKDYKRAARFKGSYCESDNGSPSQPLENCKPGKPDPVTSGSEGNGSGTDGGGVSKKAPPPAPEPSKHPVLQPPGSTDCPKPGSVETAAGNSKAGTDICGSDKWISASTQKPDECSTSKGTITYCNQGATNEDKSYWKCDCGAPPAGYKINYIADSNGTPIKCTVVGGGSGSSGSSRPNAPGPLKSKDTGLSGFWTQNKSWMLPTMLGAGLLGLWYYGTKKSLKSRYDLLTPAATATPVPATTDTTIYKGTR
jgi:hypothetical protein